MCVCVFVCFFHWRCDLSFLSSCLGFVFRAFLLRTYGKSLSNHHLREYVLELFSNIEESHGHLTLADWDVCWVASLVPVKRCNPLKFQIQPGGQTGTATWLLQRSGAMGCGGSTGDGTDGKPKIWWFNFLKLWNISRPKNTVNDSQVKSKKGQPSDDRWHRYMHSDIFIC